MRRPRLLLAWLALLVFPACNEQTVEDVPVPPSVTILEPDASDGVPEFILGEPAVFIAYATDNQDAPETLAAAWSTSWLDADAVPQTAPLGETPIDEQGRTSLTTTELAVGAHTVEIEVTDSDGQAGYASVTVQVVEVDDPPSVEISAPAEGDVFDEHDAVNFAGIAADDHDVTLLTVVWESDLHVSALDGASPAGNGAIGFQTDALVPGEHTIIVTVTDGGGHEASDTVGITVIAENLPPSMPAVAIDPLGPDTEDELTCLASGSVDPEGELVTYAYAWDVDGNGFPWTGQVIDATETETGEQWTCYATPADPSGLEGDTGYATVIVGNTLPSYSSVVLTPTTAYEDSVLECTPSGWFDPDGDPEGALYEWWVAGAQSAAAGAQLTGTDFDHFDDVYCVVVPFDGVDQGLPLTSNTVTIDNTPPADPVVQLDPDPLHYDQDLECQVVTPDPDLDGDILAYTYRWTRNGVLEPTYVDPIIPAADTALGDEWTCEVQADDGTDLSGWSAATTWVLPYEGDLVITEVMIDPSAVDDGAGEYVEIYNAALETLPLDGFELSDGGADQHVITSGNQADVVPGDHFVLGINANDATNGGVEVDYQYADFELDNAPDAITLSFLGVVLDTVVYDWGNLFPAPTGQAMSLDPGLIDAADNDDGASWCASAVPLFEWGDFGTPGAANDTCDCYYSDGDGDGFGTDGSCPADYLDCDDGDPGIHPAAYDVCEDGIDQDCVDGDRECTCVETDADGDGYGTAPDCPEIDCDDTDAAVNPGAVEVCNGIDDDCNGSADDGLTFESWFQDADGDGHGDPASEQYVCSGQPASGWVQLGDDCDDGDAGRFPGNQEACNGVDDDCDGVVDDNLTFVDWYYDGDGDAHGDPNNHQYICDGPPAGNWVQNDDDCDDSDPANFHGNNESCDGGDNDCDGNVDEGENNQYCTTFYLDGDGDGYGDANYHKCLCAPDYGANYDTTDDDDCYDGNANARPYQTSYYTSHRGDSSYDYNCDSSQSKQYTTVASCSITLPEVCGGNDGWSGSAPSCGSAGTWKTGCHFSFDGWPWEWGCAYSGSSSLNQGCR